MENESSTNAKAAEASASAVTTNNNDSSNDEAISIGQLWDTLTTELTNMGRALTCPLCLSTYRDAVVLPCVHAYCQTCVLEAFQCGQPRCPTCLTKATKRSLAPAPILNHLVHAYKLSLRQFGLAPVKYDPQYNAMTQLGPGEAASDSDSIVATLMEPLNTRDEQNHNTSTSTSANALVDCHTHLQVSRTWQKVLQERQDNASSTIGEDNNKQQQEEVPYNNIPTKSRLHQWYYQQQQQVIASSERALIDAAKKRQNPSPSPTINLSQQQDIGMAQALEQTAADQRWTQDSSNNNFNADESQCYLTPREADSNPQPEILNQDNNLAEDESSNQQQHQQQPHSLSMAESFETTLEQQPIEEMKDNVDEEDVVVEDSKNNAEEDVVMQEHEGDNDKTSAASLPLLPIGTTPVQSNTTHSSRRNKQGDDGDDGGENEQPEMEENATHTNQHQALEHNDIAMADDNDTANKDEEQNDSRILENNSFSNQPNRNNSPSSSEASQNNNDNDNTTSTVPFQVGDIVQVQARTWPGVNKHGGIARITKVILSGGETSFSFNVEYILGGREKQVDAVFLSHPPDEMVVKEEDNNDTTLQEDGEGATNKTSSGRKSRRISTKRQRRESEEEAEIVKPEDILPPGLLKSLAKEGFDVTPKNGKENMGPNASTGSRVSMEPGTQRGRGNASGRPTRSRSETRRPRGRAAAATKAPARRTKSEGTRTSASLGRNTSRGRRGKAATPQPLQDSTESETKNMAAPALNIAEKGSEKATKKMSAAAKPTASASNKNKKKPDTGGNNTKSRSVPSKRPKTSKKSSPSKLPPLPTTTREICQLADTHYRERSQGALDSAVLTVVSSGLSETDKADLKALCREAKKFERSIHIKQTESYHASKITLCIIPALSSKEDPDNLVGQCRTLKAMRSTLAGIPLVSTSWITACRAQKQVIVPAEGMFIRTLPVKKGGGSKDHANYGVARTAAQASLRPNHTLRSCTVQLCGNFTRPPQAEVQLLLREAGADVSMQTSSTLATLRSANNTEGIVLLMCDDNCATLPAALHRQVKNVLESDDNTSRVRVVNLQWLFDSIVSGGPLESAEYAPSGSQPLDLWKLQQAKQQA